MLANLTQAVIRGVSVPLVAAAATGYISAALWKGQGAGSAAGGRWLTHPALAVAVALAVETGLGYADDAGLPNAVLLTVHLVAAAAALLALRIGLHHVLLHEGQCAGQGVAGECPNCGRTGPDMPFCPDCGVTERASGYMAEDGELAFTGGPAQGHSADEIVTSLQQANAPNAVPDYVMPGASLGYTPATARRSRSRPAAPTATRSGSR